MGHSAENSSPVSRGITATGMSADTSADLICEHGRWIPDASPSSSPARDRIDSLLEELEHLCDCAVRDRAPAVQQIGDELVSVSPGPPADQQRVTVTFAPCTTDNLLQLLRSTNAQLQRTQTRLSQAEDKLASQDEQLFQYAMQVSEDLEELTWLRTLAQHLELSETGNSTDRIAESVLPTLCRLTRSTTIVLVRDLPITPADRNLPVIWQT
ncbi:MAG: hypothetical protein KDA85_05615, partial [Planctomycetaceae bacterium]|nr:hypothetical protein [Planctomycetaceae bacterium]